MEIDLIIKRYSDNLTNLNSALCYVIDELHDLSHGDPFFSSKHVEKYNYFIAAILSEIEHVKREINYLKDLAKKEFNL